MRLVMLYRPDSEYARQAEEYVHDFTRPEANRAIELMSIDTRQGSDLARLYDVMTYPAIIAMQNDGQVLKMWGDGQFPLMNELAFYAQN